MKPDIRITWNDGFALAYQVVGSSRDDLVYLSGFEANVDLMWDIPIYRRFLESLASFTRLITLDLRGVGCSDRLPPGRSPTLEEMADDVLAVMEAAMSPRATLFAIQESCFPALLVAAMRPEAVERLVLFGASPSWMRSDDLPDEWTEERWDRQHRTWERVTNATEFADGYIRGTVPSLFGDEETKRALASLLLNTSGFGSGVTISRMLSSVDLRGILPSVTVPTLVLRRANDQIMPPSSGRYLAEHLREAEYVEVPGQDALPWVGDHEPVLAEIERFMGVHRPEPASDRRLTSVLFTDIVDSSARATALGDAEWGRVLAEHHRAVRGVLAAHDGVEIDTAGDGFFATFEGPAQAVRCALAAVRSVEDLGLDIRVGVHTGEVEAIDGKPSGAAVVIGARITAMAGPGDVMTSQTVKDLTAGSGLVFEDAGEHELKGVPDRWRLFRVMS